MAWMEWLAAARTGGISRRRFLGAGAATMAAAGMSNGSALGARRPGAGRASAITDFDPALVRLIQRTTFGFDRATYMLAEKAGYEGFLEMQVAPESIDDSETDVRLSAYPALEMTSEELLIEFGSQMLVPARELVDATIVRGIYSRRQLFERVVEFWNDHFSIDILDGLCRILKITDDREVIRKHALDSFPQLLNASARSAAMLFYLDNYANVAGNAQENYARELMELHTLGDATAYTQQDVQEVARCFTGWSFRGMHSGAFGEFVFRPQDHDDGPKVVLGHRIPAGGGVEDGQMVLDILATHPTTAQSIARKLCVRFLGDNPPEDIVTAVKQTYLDTGGSVRDMLRLILHPAVQAGLATSKLKRPFHLVCSLLRATEAEVTVTRELSGVLVDMGHLPFHWAPPNGYPDSLGYWGNSVLGRWRWASQAVEGSIPGTSIATPALLAAAGGLAPGQQAAAINDILCGGTMTAAEVQLVQDVFDVAPLPFAPAARDALSVAASMPSFQWY